MTAFYSEFRLLINGVCPYLSLIAGICTGRKACFALEGTGKVIDVRIAQRSSDFGYTADVVAEHFFGFADAQVLQIFKGRNTVDVAEQLAKIGSGELCLR